MSRNKTLLIGAAIAATSIGSLGAVSAASADTSSSSSGSSSIIDKIASKFNLNRDEVKAVFDADRASHDAARKADQTERLAAAVKAGKITQAQSDYITKALAEIDSLRGSAGPDSETTTQRDQIKAKMDALRTWATDNKVDMQYVMPFGHGGPGGPRGDRSPNTSSSTTTTN